MLFKARPYTLLVPRHKLPPLALDLPKWVKVEDSDCLRSIAEEVYTARALALHYGAAEHPSCQELLRAGDKSRTVMDDAGGTIGARCEAGERALRKFWEAKTCARRQQPSAPQAHRYQR